MVEITKEDVLDLYQGLNASHRLELVCALLDHSLPFELRFLGSVIENLGRKDFHILRDAENKANSISGEAQDSEGVIKILSEGPAPNVTMNPQGFTGGGGGGSSHSGNEGRAGVGEKKREKSQKDIVGRMVENGVSSKTSTPGSSGSSNSSALDASEMCFRNVKGENKELGNHVDANEEKELWLLDGVKRRKLILYLSLMSATNHDSANLYYLLLSDVDLLESLEWLVKLEEIVRNEIWLLYTIGRHHPAFSFEQRTFLCSVINRFKDCMIRYTKDCYQNVVQVHPNQNQYSHFNQHYFYYPQQQFMLQMLHPSYQYSLPFTIPPQQINNVHISKSMMPNNQSPQPNAPKDVPKPQQPQGNNIGPGSGYSGLIPMPVHPTNMNPITNPPRSKSFPVEVVLPNPSGDFPSISTLNTPLMPGLEDPIYVISRPRKISCYNCGSNQHLGSECKEASMEEMTKVQYRLNFGGDDGE